MTFSKSVNKRSLCIRPMIQDNLLQVAAIHAECFPRQTRSVEWITCNHKAYPRIRYFVAEIAKQIVGYIQWIEKSGFRTDVVMELEQIAVQNSMQNRGIATALILQSLPMIQNNLEKRNAHLKHVVVTTRTDNHAQELYKKTLQAQAETTITNLFSADEVFMIARNVKI